MHHNALVGGHDDVAELTGGKDGGDKVFELVDGQIEVGGDHTALVEAAVELNNDLAGTGIVDNGVLVDVALLLHEGEELDKSLGDRAEDNLYLLFRLCTMKNQQFYSQIKSI